MLLLSQMMALTISLMCQRGVAVCSQFNGWAWAPTVPGSQTKT